VLVLLVLFLKNWPVERFRNRWVLANEGPCKRSIIPSGQFKGEALVKLELIAGVDNDLKYAIMCFCHRRIEGF
jgi:hypothetical protein